METKDNAEGHTKLNKSLKRRADILHVAMHILTQDGYGELSMRRIAKDAGMSLGNLQYHFPNKKSIIQNLLTGYLDQALQKIQKPSSAGETSAEERLETALNISLAEQQSKEACQIIYELWALATRDQDAAAALKNFYEQYCRIAADFLQQMNPTLGKATAHKRAALVVAMLEGLSLYHLWEKSSLLSPAELEKEFKLIIKTIILAD